jgi:hypothetical protein
MAGEPVSAPDSKAADLLAISKAWRSLARARTEFMVEAMRPYDKDVFWPARTALKEQCAALGHGPQIYNRNGLGWGWKECTICHSRTEEWQEDERAGT